MTRNLLTSIAVLSIALFACGGVSASDPDGGGDGDGDGDDDAQNCAGETDDGGTCVCPPRFVGDDCDQCADGWSGATCNEFNDDFNRASGALGDNYVAPTLAGVEEAIILNDRACGDTQSLGLLGERPLRGTQVTAEITFTSPTTEGLEAGFVLSGAENALDDFVIAGCDGGGGNCRLRISELNQMPIAELDVTLAVDNVYRFTLTIAGGMITLRLDEVGMSELIGTITGALPNGFRLERFGFITGREPDVQLTCVDDLQLVLAAVAAP